MSEMYIPHTRFYGDMGIRMHADGKRRHLPAPQRDASKKQHLRAQHEHTLPVHHDGPLSCPTGRHGVVLTKKSCLLAGPVLLFNPRPFFDFDAGANTRLRKS